MTGCRKSFFFLYLSYSRRHRGKQQHPGQRDNTTSYIKRDPFGGEKGKEHSCNTLIPSAGSEDSGDIQGSETASLSRQYSQTNMIEWERHMLKG